VVEPEIFVVKISVEEMRHYLGKATYIDQMKRGRREVDASWNGKLKRVRWLPWEVLESVRRRLDEG